MDIVKIQEEVQSYLRFGPTYIPDIHTLDETLLILARYRKKVLNPLKGENNDEETIHEQCDWLEDAKTSIEETINPSNFTGDFSRERLRKTILRKFEKNVFLTNTLVMEMLKKKQIMSKLSRIRKKCFKLLQMEDIRGALFYGKIYEAETFKYLRRFKITGKCEENLKEKVKITLNKAIL